MNLRMKNLRQTKISMQVEGEPAIGEAEVKAEVTRVEDMATIITEERTDGVGIEKTARRCNLGS